jgi:hypothetical protein
MTLNISRLGRPLSGFEYDTLVAARDNKRDLWSLFLFAWYGEYLRKKGLLRWVNPKEPDKYELTQAGGDAILL